MFETKNKPQEISTRYILYRTLLGKNKLNELNYIHDNRKSFQF